MIQIQQSPLTFNAVKTNYQRQAEITSQVPIKNTQSKINISSQISVKTESINSNLIRAELSTRNINEATALIQSVQESATLIETKFVDMKALAMQNGGCNCQAMRKAQESVRDLSNNFSWNGTNFLAGGGENNQKTSLRNFSVSTGTGAKDDFQISFKSFNPMSAVDTDGSLEPLTPNLPDLNKSSGTDTHAFGDAALYSKLNQDAYLHTHTKAMKEQAVIQITRAIEGIKSEKERLGGYLDELTHISETNQSKTLDKNKYQGQGPDIKQPDQLAIYLKNEIRRGSIDVKLAQLNIDATTFNRLLN